MIQTSRAGRSLPTYHALQDVRDQFTRNGALGQGRYPVTLDQAASGEYELRAKALSDIAKRVFVETETAWTRSAGNSVLHLLELELVTDWDELLDVQRSMVGPGGSIRFDVLEATKNRMRKHIAEELDLLILRQDKTRLPLDDALAAPRYASVRAAWTKADRLFRNSPPDLANAAKEAVGATEQLARILTGNASATLGDAIKHLRNSSRLQAPLLKGLEELWALTSATPGIRHGGATTPMDPVAAQYVFDLAQAGIRLLLSLSRYRLTKHFTSRRTSMSGPASRATLK
ncbi:MAG TPA: hypothetical protein VGJ62_13840 [Gemmatimonadaceae bacterium]